ncbi:MAG: PH domain-containing protein [bacterium]
MNELNKVFPGQEADEKVYLVIRKHWFVFVPIFLLAFVMILPILAVPIFGSMLFPDTSQLMGDAVIVVLSIYLLIALASVGVAFVDYYLDIYIITDERIVNIAQVGLFKREISELHLRQVQDVSAKVTGIFGTLLDFGDVQIQNAANKENFIFPSVPNPYYVAKKITDLHEAQIEGTDMDLLFQPSRKMPQKKLDFTPLKLIPDRLFKKKKRK